jgi:hypothetical protein
MPGFSNSNMPTQRPLFIPFEFPRLPTSTPYDKHIDGFWDYPERAHWMVDGLCQYRKFPNHIRDGLRSVRVDDLDSRYKCRQTSIPESIAAHRLLDSLRIKCFKASSRSPSDIITLAEEVSFLHEWLFFGVLEQVNDITGVQADIQREFVVQQQLGVLSTRALDSLAYRWIAALAVLEANDRETRWTQLLNIVLHVFTLQTVISTYRPARATPPRKLSYDECKVLLAVRVLFCTILFVLSRTMNLNDSSDSLGFLRLLVDPALLQGFPADFDEMQEFAVQDMRIKGWCASEVRLLEPFSGMLAFFATRLSTNRWQVDHARCDEWTCAADQVDELVYETVHTEAGCHCAMVDVRSEELCAVLERGVVPRVVLSDDGVVVVDDSRPYVAISHVCRCVYLSSKIFANISSRGAWLRKSSAQCIAKMSDSTTAR